MGIYRAYAALTNPKPGDRDVLVKFCAERLTQRGKKRSYPVSKDDCYHMILVLQRWGWITKNELPTLSRRAVGDLVGDIYDAAKIMQTEGL